ncbi:EfeM/EfeO family lipoprotein [Gryllotalpicola protaetiae]|uniref:EfeM/EfeO family lipoprotein n=1 Tax=Gryllotalpicola protaetiae TaxID=2419771 RepID=A0A387BMV2_9MICO|nr:EfeM/EfeO family lipoprotein [Gryllotalpicola protaetiae]AYG03732.1 EfeM/EfeO family lipoprotein [Gryllotalpicola protaetiae]
MSKRSQYALFWVVVAVIVAIGVVATVTRAPAHAGNAGAVAAQSAQAHSYDLTANRSTCGVGWGASVPGGEQDFSIANGNDAPMDIQLQERDSKKVFLELDGVGAGSKVGAQVVLAKGRYRFACYPEDEPPAIGATVHVGAAPPNAVLSAGVQPLTRNQLNLVAIAYGKWVDGRLPTLQQQVGRLDDDAEEGDLAAAKADWLTAHLTYETLGAAYDAFGDHDAEINGTPASGQTALGDPDLTGFHKIEALLWSGAPASAVAAQTQGLVQAVASLVADPGTSQIDPLLIGLRSHEIVENAIQFELTGATDAGSHTNLATIDANLTGATAALSFLKSDLASRYSALPDVEAALASTQKLVESYRADDGTWLPLQSLTQPQRQQLNASLGGLVELLAPIAEIAEPRFTADE